MPNITDHNAERRHAAADRITIKNLPATSAAVTVSAALTASVTHTVSSLKHLPGALLPIQHKIQHQLGYIPSEVIPDIAQQLNLSRAEVHGVVSFYPDFRTHPCGQYLLRICAAEACQANGARALMQHAEETLHIKSGHTTADRSITLEAVYCLGNCTAGPSVEINQRLHGRVTATLFDQLTAELITAELITAEPITAMPRPDEC